MEQTAKEKDLSRTTQYLMTTARVTANNVEELSKKLESLEKAILNIYSDLSDKGILK